MTALQKLEVNFDCLSRQLPVAGHAGDEQLRELWGFHISCGREWAWIWSTRPQQQNSSPIRVLCMAAA